MKDKDIEKIIEYLYLHDAGTPIELQRYILRIGKSTFYKKIKKLLELEIILRAPKNVWGGQCYALGDDKRIWEYYMRHVLRVDDKGVFEKSKNRIIKKAIKLKIIEPNFLTKIKDE